ncbi:MAG: winged helix-turn-helix domain-containing protein [Thermoleophilia bacterium]
MRPITTQRNALRYPLDDVLGSEAHVRLIRVLVHEVDAPLGVSDAARLAGLTPAGARKALHRLEESGFVERVGSGRAQKYGLREHETAFKALGQLFAHEQQHYDDFIAGLRGAVALQELRAAWVERLPVGPKEPMEVAVVVEAGAIAWIREELRSRIIGLEKEFNLIIEVSVFTRADAPTPGPDALFLWGTESNSRSRERRGPQTHAEADERSLLMAQGVAELMRTDPSLIKRAEQHLDRLIREGQGTAGGDITEWRQLLQTYSPERLRDLLVSTSSRAVRLRQSSPFFAVLTADERDHLLAKIEKRR